MYHTDIPNNSQLKPNSGRDFAFLGIRPNISSDLDSDTKAVTDKSINALSRKRAKFAILDFTQDLLREHNVLNRNKSNVHRTCTCMQRMNGKMIDGKYVVNQSMEVWHDGKNASFRGLRTCASVWSCPVCTERIAIARAAEIKRAVQWARENGYFVAMLTVTASHSKQDKLVDLKLKFRDAWTYFTSGSVWQNLKKKIGVEQWIAAREVTHGDENGWHPHLHVLLVINPAVLREYESNPEINMEKTLKLRWMKACERSGLTCSYERGANVAAIGDVGDSYLTKMGIVNRSDVDPSHELTANRRKGSSQWDLLQRAYDGCEKSARLFADFSRAMSGQRWITWSRGFKDLIAMDDVTDEEILEQPEVTESELLTMIDRDWWRLVCLAKARGDLLKYASKNRNEKMIWGYLWQIAQSYYRNFDDREAHFERLQFCTNFKRPRADEILAHPDNAPPSQSLMFSPDEIFGRYE